MIISQKQCKIETWLRWKINRETYVAYGVVIATLKAVIIFTSFTEGDGRLCFRRRRYVGRYL